MGDFLGFLTVSQKIFERFESDTIRREETNANKTDLLVTETGSISLITIAYNPSRVSQEDEGTFSSTAQ